MNKLINGLVGAYFTRKAGMFRVYRGISTCLSPSDPALYRSLLPAVFDVPEEPKVMIFVADYEEVAPWPMTRYLEASVALETEYAGESGWYVLTMPVTKKVPLAGGRNIGFPKYMADEIRLEETDGGWRGEEIHDGASRLRLDYTAGVTRELEPWEKAFWDDPAFFKGCCHLLLPPEIGPTKMRIAFDHRVEPEWSPHPGMVGIAIAAEMPWFGLISPMAEAPGVFTRFTGGTNLIAREMA